MSERGLAFLTSRVRSLWERATKRHAATVGLIRDSAAEAQRSRLPQMAAALAYRTVFGLIPVFVVSLVAFKVFFANDKSKLADLISRVLDYFRISSIAVQNVPAVDPVAATSPLPNENLEKLIRDLVEKVSDINYAAVGYVGLAALIYAAVSMLVEVERAFNQIYRVPVGRSWVRRITQYWTLMTLGTLGLAATFVVGEKFNTWLHGTVTWGGPGGAVFLATVGYLTTVCITVAMFLLAYTVVPNTRVQIGPALAGAALAGLAWEAGKWGLSQYVRYSAGYSQLYGSLALLPLFLVWVYTTWVIVLFGLNFAYYLQYGRRHAKAQPTEPVAPVIVDPASVLALMAALAKRFREGKPSEARDLTADVGVPEAIVRQMLERLAAAGLLLAVRTDEEPTGQFTPARPAERISAGEVLRVGEELTGGVRSDPVYTSMREARLDRVGTRTLASFIGDDGQGTAGPVRDVLPSASMPIPETT